MGGGGKFLDLRPVQAPPPKVTISAIPPGVFNINKH